LGTLAAFFFQGVAPFQPADLQIKGAEPEAQRRALQWVAWRLEEVTPFTAELIAECLKGTAALAGIKTKDFLKPFFVAMTGKPVGTPLWESMAILGRDLCRARLRAAIEALGPMSGKEEKKWRKELDDAQA
jgi:glutamyl-tRNA synthetase